MDATFGGGLVVLELALFLSQLEQGVVRDKGGEMVLDRDRWITIMSRKQKSLAGHLPGSALWLKAPVLLPDLAIREA